MTSVQAAREIIHEHVVEPASLNYVNQGLPDGANWILPSAANRDAFLEDARTIDVTGEVDRKVTAFGTLTVAFELELSAESFGFEKSDVQVGVRLVNFGNYFYQSIQKQIAEMKPLEKTWVTADFPVT